jgi:hypothetical protein
MASTSLSLGLRSRTQLARVATVALIGIAYFAAAIIVLHVLRSSDNPLRQTTSEYAVGTYGYVMTSAYLSVSLASMALVIGLYQSVAPPARSKIGLGLLGLWAVGVLVAMIFPIDLEDAPQTTAGAIHSANGPMTFLSLSLGAFLVSRRLKYDEHWLSVQRFAFILSLGILGAFVVTGLNVAADTGLAGLFQRVLLMIFVTWFVVIATRLRMLAGGGA